MPVRSQFETYRIEDRVARGRSGDVYRAVGPDDATVALKIHERATDGRQEAERLARIDHPNVVAVLDQGTTTDGRFWLALPWISGQTLGHRLAASPPRPLDEVRGWVRQLASAVDALHEAGIVHGDLSADNVLVGDDGQVTLIDLATSTPIEATAIERTSGLDVATTPRYASPEVAGGRPPGRPSDVYALGLIAYEALTGAFPFPEVATPIAMLGHHATTDPVPPSEHRPSLSPATDAIVLWALAKQPDDRPASARDFAVALDREQPPASQRPPRRHWPVVVALTVLAAGAAILTPVLTGVDDGDNDSDDLAVADGPAIADGPASAGTAWPVGTAAGLSCNLLQQPDFDDGALPDDFYRGDPTNTTARADGLGVAGTPALRVGADDTFGLYGEIVAIGSHTEFVFGAWVEPDGPPDTVAFYVDYLDDRFVQLTAERDDLDPGQRIEVTEPGRIELRSIAPDGAEYAVPTFFKDGSAGSLLVDEVVFGPASTCGDRAS